MIQKSQNCNHYNNIERESDMKNFFTIPLVCVLLFSCQIRNQHPIEQLENLTEDIRLYHQEYTVADWKRAYYRYEQIVLEMEEYNFTNEEMKRIGNLEGECVGYFMKYAANSFDGLTNEISGFFNGLNESLKESGD